MKTLNGVIKFFLFVGIFSFLTVSCLEREELAVRNSEYISFIADLQLNQISSTKSVSSDLTSESEEWNLYDTKANPTLSLEGDARVYAYHYPSSTTNTPDFIYSVDSWELLSGKTFKFDGDELRATPPIRWDLVPSTSDYFRVYAFAPFNKENDQSIPGLTFPAAGVITGPPVLEYTLPTDLSQQTDIITAVKEVDPKLKQDVILTFTHALTGLKFKMGFPCYVKSVTVSGVGNRAFYTLGKGWSDTEKVLVQGKTEYTLNLNDETQVLADEFLSNEVMLMILQTLVSDNNANPHITVVYKETPDGEEQKISASLAGRKWEEGKLITYTLHKIDPSDDDNFIYFDLAAGNVTISDKGYKGYLYDKDGNLEEIYCEEHKSSNKYYIFQSSSFNRSETGIESTDEEGNKNVVRPVYDPVSLTINGATVFWSDFITNNKSVESVIENWTLDNLKKFNREATGNWIKISTTQGVCNLTLDNLYSTKQGTSNVSTDEGIVFTPGQTETSNSKLILNLVGDNRFGNIYYVNSCKNKNQLIFEGSGSLTVCDVDGIKSTRFTECGYGYSSNYWKGVIGSNDSDGGPDNCYGIVFNSGVIFAGSTKAENATAIGGGGNGEASITINGGVITAVATTTGAAIGGGMAINAEGGGGDIIIKGGNVYAYNFENGYKIPCAAIGGGGSIKQNGNYGNVTITGGNVYAYSVGGTAIGGGSSQKYEGGPAIVTITGGNVLAISAEGKTMPAGAGIGGGTGGSESGSNGGKAEVYISGNPIIRTGSIGGGKTSNATGYIGSAEINIDGGDIQAQFVMAAGAQQQPTFIMTGGHIRNSYTNDNEYIHVQKNGGAVYMEDGTFTMSGGTISNCSGEYGGAIYIKGSGQTKFNMSGGEIERCISSKDGGAIYLSGGIVSMSGGSIMSNLAKQGNGGGVCVVGGNFYMTEGSIAIIEKNAAYSKNQSGCGSGGGIYVTSANADVTVDILSGKIQYNSSDRTGGGLSVNVASGNNVAAYVNVGKEGVITNANPLITGNRASIYGGGLYVNGKNANIVINDGKIKDNHTVGYVSNPDIANDRGTVTLKGGDVSYKTVTYIANADVYGESVYQQKVVTSTNNLMIDLSAIFVRTGWVITGWHTHKGYDDTKGKRFSANDILNINSDIELYAIWEYTAN